MWKHMRARTHTHTHKYTHTHKHTHTHHHHHHQSCTISSVKNTKMHKMSANSWVNNPRLKGLTIHIVSPHCVLILFANKSTDTSKKTAQGCIQSGYPHEWMCLNTNSNKKALICDIESATVQTITIQDITSHIPYITFCSPLNACFIE